MIKAIYLDIGGVVLTNGWDTSMRQHAAEQFGFDFEKMNKRHNLMYSTHELGKMSLDTYLDYVVFNEARSFSKDDFKQFMYAQSQPYPEMLALIAELKQRYRLKIGAVSNEGKELTEYRVKHWLIDVVDFFCVSCFVQYRKPDLAIFQLALNLGQISAHEVVYLEDRQEFVAMARSLGYHAMQHTSYQSTKEMLETLLRQRDD